MADSTYNGTYIRLLKHAASVLGGEDRLRQELRATPEQFAFWIQGKTALPPAHFLRLVDLLEQEHDRQLSGGQAQT